MSSPFVEYELMHPFFPFLGTAIYCFVNYSFWPEQKRSRQNTSAFLKPFVFLHNVVLMAYSAWVFYMTAGHFYAKWSAQPFTQFMDTSYKGEDWKDFGFVCWTFYLSKFYEYLDTWVILYKGGKPGNLQQIHHIGAVWTMWLLTLTNTPCSWIFVIFNSLIHSLMYCYYAITTLGFKFPLKIAMTTMQITQFIVGIYVACTYIASGALLPIQSLVVSLTMSYVFVVLYLFCEFFATTYLVKRNKVVLARSDSAVGSLEKKVE